MKHTKNMVIKESIESRELSLYAENESKLYFGWIVPVCRNLAKKYAKGNFDHSKAVDAFFHVASAAAKMYCKEFAKVEDAPQIFDVTARYTTAAYLLESFMENIEKNDL